MYHYTQWSSDIIQIALAGHKKRSLGNTSAPAGLPLSASTRPLEPRAPTAQKQFFKRTTALTLPDLLALHVPSEPPHFVKIQFRHPNFLDALPS